LPAKDQEEFRTAWCALSGQRQQDAAVDVEEQFEAHMLKIGIPVDESDLKVFRADWAKEHFLQIIQAKDETKEGTTNEFPFAANLWPQKIVDAYKKIWLQWSDLQKEDAAAMMQASFREYTIEVGIADEETSKNSSLWETWGLKGFKDVTAAVMAKVVVAGFIFKPEVSIDMIKDEEGRKKAMTIQHNRVNEDQDKLIKQEILRRKDVLRQQLAGLDTATITKYENRLVEGEYWNIAMQVVEGNLVEAPTQNEGRQAKHFDERNFNTPPRHGGAGTASASSSPSVALCRALAPDSVPVPTRVAATTVPVDHGADSVNIARLVKQNCSPRPAAPGAALEFGSARAALSGDLQGVRWIYDCYLASADFEYRNGAKARKR